MDSHYKILFFLCIFSILYSLFFINIYHYPVLGDGGTYYTYGVNLYNGNGYSWQKSPPFSQSNLREPGYPFFIYGVFKVFGISKSVIQISQVILNAIIIIATYSIANLIFADKRLSLISGCLTAVSPTIAGYAAFIFSETLAAACLMLLFVSLFLLFKKQESIHIIILSALTGLFCGCLVLTKMTYCLLPLFIGLIILLNPWNLPYKYKYKIVLCIAVTFISVLLPWLVFNNNLYGNPLFLTNRGGITIAAKSERLNWTHREILISFIYPVSEGLVQRFFPDEYKRITYNPVDGSVFKTVFDRYDSLISNGYNEMDADKQLRVEAWKRIKRHFLKYTILSIADFHYMLYFEGLPLSQFTDFFKRETRLAINAFFKIYSLLIIFFAVKGGFIMLRKKENAVIKTAFLLPIFYTFFMYSAIFGAPRFTFTIIPFIYILASVSIYEMIKLRMPL